MVKTVSKFSPIPTISKHLLCYFFPKFDSLALVQTQKRQMVHSVWLGFFQANMIEGERGGREMKPFVEERV